MDTPVELTLAGRSSEEGSRSGDPLLGLLSAGIGPDQQEVIPVYGHLRAGCLNSPVYSSSHTSMKEHQVPIGGGQTQTPVMESSWSPTFSNQPSSALLRTVFVLDISDTHK